MDTPLHFAGSFRKFADSYCVRILTSITAVLLMSSLLHAADLRLEWDPNSESDLAGYKVYYGTSQGVYNLLQTLGKVTTFSIPTNLAPATYYFVVTAYNDSGLESAYSNEVQATFSGCDNNRDGVANAMDLQSLINRIMTANQELCADVNKDGRIDALDLQILVNVILQTRSCP